MDRYLKTFFTALAVVMLVAGTMAPVMAVSSKTYSFEDNLEVAMHDTAYEELYVPGEILVKFSPGVSEAKINAVNSKNGASVTYTSPHAGFKVMKIPKTKTVEEMVEIYSKNPNVEFATANYMMHAAYEPNDPMYIGNQWNFYNTNTGINVTEAWDASTGKTAVVAILDTGIAYENYGRKYLVAPDLAGTSFSENVWDFVNNDAHPNDDEGHGTHVAGTIAQTTNNSYGVAGVAFDCTLMPVKVLDKKGSGTLQYLIDGIVFATDNGADVISMSLSFSPGYEPPGLEYYINYAYNNGVTVVAAAGNDGEDTVCYPAAYDNCIAVGATEKDGSIAPYSNYGEKIDVMAPGTAILQQTFNLIPTNFGFWFYSGTSMATPHVAGVAALLIDNGVEGPDNIKEAIENTKSSYNIVDAYGALNYFNEAPVEENQAPVASMVISPTTAEVGEAIQFDATGSYDPDGTIVSYSWDFDGDGTVDTTTTIPTIEHSYSEPENYNAILTVTDDEGVTDSATGSIVITESGTSQPIEYSVYVVVSEPIETKTAGKNVFAYSEATITVKDGDGKFVSDADFSGHWTGLTSDVDEGTTDANGETVVRSDVGRYPDGTDPDFNFVVDSVNGVLV